MFGFMKSEFARAVENLSRRTCGFIKTSSDKRAVLTWAQNGRHYSIGLIIQPDGLIHAQIMNAFGWRGRPPAAAHVLAETMNRKSERVTWEVHEFGDGDTHIIGWIKLRNAGTVASDEFVSLTAEMIGFAAEADDMLRKNRYA